MTLQWFNDFHGEDEIKKQKKILIKEHHPDKHMNNENNRLLATRKTQSINAEYDWLSKSGWNVIVQQERPHYSYDFRTGGIKEDNVRWENAYNSPFNTNNIFEQFFKQQRDTVYENIIKDREKQEQRKKQNFEARERTIRNIIRIEIDKFQHHTYGGSTEFQNVGVIYSTIGAMLALDIMPTKDDFKLIQEMFGFPHRSTFIPNGEDFYEIWWKCYVTLSGS